MKTCLSGLATFWLAFFYDGYPRLRLHAIQGTSDERSEAVGRTFPIIDRCNGGIIMTEFLVLRLRFAGSYLRT